LCYRATDPQELIGLQAAGWDPLIDWATARHDAPLRVTQGVIPVDQPDDSLTRLHAQVVGLDLYGLTALHDLVTIPGSLLLGLAVIQDRVTVEEAFHLSRIDEDFQITRWGDDEDAQQVAASRLLAMKQADHLWRLSRRG
ncbi:MAG: ATPase, partial [Paracoccus sp. (in: a-proteobacteria)]|nr:ATPase [Paracoccus sp. (in: a-proteobacteria)]